MLYLINVKHCAPASLISRQKTDTLNENIKCLEQSRHVQFFDTLVTTHHQTVRYHMEA